MLYRCVQRPRERKRAITNVFYAGELRESFVQRHVHCSTAMSRDDGER